MYRAALSSILSELARQERLVVVDEFSVDQPKTKMLVQKLGAMQVDEALIVTDEVDRNLQLSARNLHKVDVRQATSVDPVSLLAFEKVLITVGAVKKLEEMLG